MGDREPEGLRSAIYKPSAALVLPPDITPMHGTERAYVVSLLGDHQLADSIRAMLDLMEGFRDALQRARVRGRLAASISRAASVS